MEKLGIYIHVPFCKSKCFYCNFSSIACQNLKKDTEENLISRWYKAVITEIINKAEFITEYKIDTIYIGGGTPSLVNENYIVDIINLIKNIADTKDAEITIELNPGTVTNEKISAYKSVGVNRFSIGMQSTKNDVLKKIGRIHKIEEVEECINILKENNIENYSLDYIYGLPDQNIENIKDEIETIIKLNPKHISTYDLEVHEESKLEFLIENAYLVVPTDDEVVDIRHIAEDILEKNGYEKYEISNFAKKGFESKHNNRYWNQKKYIGFGPAASSFYDGMRFTNISDLNEYLDKIENGKSASILEEELDKLGLMREYIILKLRLKYGVNREEFYQKFKEDIDKYFLNEISKLKKLELLKEENENIFLTQKGLDLANMVWEEFI